MDLYKVQRNIETQKRTKIYFMFTRIYKIGIQISWTGY